MDKRIRKTSFCKWIEPASFKYLPADLQRQIAQANAYVRKADKSALTYEKIGNLTLNEQRSAQWGKFIFFSLGQDLGARH